MGKKNNGVKNARVTKKSIRDRKEKDDEKKEKAEAATPAVEAPIVTEVSPPPVPDPGLGKKLIEPPKAPKTLEMTMRESSAELFADLTTIRLNLQELSFSGLSRDLRSFPLDQNKYVVGDQKSNSIPNDASLDDATLRLLTSLVPLGYVKNFDAVAGLKTYFPQYDVKVKKGLLNGIAPVDKDNLKIPLYNIVNGQRRAANPTKVTTDVITTERVFARVAESYSLTNSFKAIPRTNLTESKNVSFKPKPEHVNQGTDYQVTRCRDDGIFIVNEGDETEPVPLVFKNLIETDSNYSFANVRRVTFKGTYSTRGVQNPPSGTREKGSLSSQRADLEHYVSMLLGGGGLRLTMKPVGNNEHLQGSADALGILGLLTIFHVDYIENVRERFAQAIAGSRVAEFERAFAHLTAESAWGEYEVGLFNQKIKLPVTLINSISEEGVTDHCAGQLTVNVSKFEAWGRKALSHLRYLTTKKQQVYLAYGDHVFSGVGHMIVDGIAQMRNEPILPLKMPDANAFSTLIHLDPASAGAILNGVSTLFNGKDVVYSHLQMRVFELAHQNELELSSLRLLDTIVAIHNLHSQSRDVEFIVDWFCKQYFTGYDKFLSYLRTEGIRSELLDITTTPFLSKVMSHRSKPEFTRRTTRHLYFAHNHKFSQVEVNIAGAANPLPTGFREPIINVGNITELNSQEAARVSAAGYSLAACSDTLVHEYDKKNYARNIDDRSVVHIELDERPVQVKYGLTPSYLPPTSSKCGLVVVPLLVDDVNEPVVHFMVPGRRLQFQYVQMPVHGTLGEYFGVDPLDVPKVCRLSLDVW